MMIAEALRKKVSVETVEMNKEEEANMNKKEELTKVNVETAEMNKEEEANMNKKEELTKVNVETVEMNKEEEAVMNKKEELTKVNTQTEDVNNVINMEQQRKQNFEERQRAIDSLKKKGITIDYTNQKEVMLAESLDGMYKLWMKAVKSRKKELAYKIYEVEKDGMTDDMENNKNRFTNVEIKKGDNKIRNAIINLQGQYEYCLSDIMLNMSEISKNRLLNVMQEDTDVLTGPEIVEELKEWLENHIIDPRVGMFMMNDRIHIALVKRGEKTPNKIFEEIMKEIAPANKASVIKDWLYNNDMLVHDLYYNCKHSQKSISESAILETGAVSSKCIAFNFSQEYLEKLYKVYSEKKQNQEIA